MDGENKSTTKESEAVAHQQLCSGHWHVWPTHWAGGSSGVQVDGHNTVWIDSDEGEIARLRTDHGLVTRRVYDRANLLAAAPDLLAACQFMENHAAVWVGTPDQARGLEMMRAAIAKALGQNALLSGAAAGSIRKDSTL